MSRSLPQDWTNGTLHSLNVVRDLGGQGKIVHTSLSVVRVKPSARSRKTQNLKWRFLPAKNDDPRPFAGRTKRGQGKRLYIEGSCGTPDPWEAAKVAISASQEKWQHLHKELEQQQAEQDLALSVYWERWFARAEQESRNQRNRWLADKQNLWKGANGLGLQPWATNKSVERISSNDFLEFFLIVRKHCEATGNSGAEARRKYKILIRHLFKEARADFPALTCPDFPAVKRQVKSKRLSVTTEEGM